MEKETIKEFQRVYEKIGDIEMEKEGIKNMVRLTCDKCGKAFYDFDDNKPYVLCKSCSKQFNKRRKL